MNGGIGTGAGSGASPHFSPTVSSASAVVNGSPILAENK